MLSIPWKEAIKHQTNLSLTKETYAFSKDKRFKDKHSVLCDSFYNIPSSLGKAPASGIGKGEKAQLAITIATPSPLSYHVKSQFELTKRGIKFGLGREKIKYNGIFNRSQTPQPGHYQIANNFSTKKGYTIYSRLNMEQPSNTKNPGPGHYKTIESLNNSGRYVLSQLTNCPGYKIKPTNIYQIFNKNPGPGHYETERQNLNKLGKYSNSKHESSRCRTFSRSMKNLVVKKQMPGPGSYNYYSQFGSRV